MANVLVLYDYSSTNILIKLAFNQELPIVRVHSLNDCLKVQYYIDSFDIDIIIVDYYISFQLVPDILEDIKKKKPGLSIIFLTIQKTTEPGAGALWHNKVFVKPFDISDLIIAVQKLLGD